MIHLVLAGARHLGKLNRDMIGNPTSALLKSLMLTLISAILLGMQYYLWLTVSAAVKAGAEDPRDDTIKKI